MKKQVLAVIGLLGSIVVGTGGFAVNARNVEADSNVATDTNVEVDTNVGVDTIAAKQLGEIVVEASYQNSSATVTSYIPTSRQKSASQTGVDLLNRMAIPQLALGNGTSISTAANQPVAIFINGLPATGADMTNIRTTDVARVEYYEYPSDARFLGNAHVVNFIVKEYAYGGYVKGTIAESFIANDGQANLFGKLQIRKMTVEVGVGGSYANSSHNYTETVEHYRIPNSSGAMSEIDRVESVAKADYLNRLFWPSLRMVYRTDKATISNTVGAAIDNTPWI